MNGKKIYGNILVFVLMGFYPFIMTNGYFNLTFTKYVVFGSITILLAFLLMMEWCLKKQSWDNVISFPKIADAWKKISLCDKFMIGFFLAEFMAFCVSKDKYMAFTGYTNKYMGLFTTILLLLVYFILRRTEVKWELFVVTSEIACSFVVIIGLLQFCGVDFFGLLEAIKNSPVQNYISTLGNTGMFGIYLLFNIPVAAVVYCITQEKELRILSGVTLFLGYTGVLISNTDGTFLGFGIIVLLLFYMYGTNVEFSMRFSEIGVIFASSGAVLSIVFKFIQHRALSRISHGMISDIVIIISLIIAFALFFTRERWGKKKKILLFLKKGLIGVTVVIVCCVVILMIYFSTVGINNNLYGLEHYLRFDDEWGTGRGYVWKRLMIIFSEKPFVNKLFGVGQGTVFTEMLSHYKAEMVTDLGYVYDNAHNVYLHYLFTIGIFGLAMYLGVLVTAILSGIKKEKDSIACMAAIALTACAVTDFVSILQPVTIPFLWMYVAFTQKSLKECKNM